MKKVFARKGAVNVRRSPEVKEGNVFAQISQTKGGVFESTTGKIDGFAWHVVVVDGSVGYVREDVVFVRDEVKNKVKLTVIHDCGDQRNGVLSVVENDRLTFFCKTLELPFKDNKNNISAIPKGVYQVKWTYSPKFKRNMYLVSGVPNRQGIRIHSAVRVGHLQGCIALGDVSKDLNKDGLLDFQHSGTTVSDFEKHMNFEDFEIEII